FVRPRKSLHGCGQVCISALYPGDGRAYFRKHAMEVDAIHLADDAVGLGAFQNSQLATRTEHADDLAQTGVVVGKIAETESGSDQIERSVGKGQVQSIGFDPAR